MSLCDSCDRRAVKDGEGERDICRWHHIVKSTVEELKEALVVEGDSPVYKYIDPAITECVGYLSNGQEKPAATVLSLVRHE